MTMAPMSCGTNAKNASRPARNDSIIYPPFPSVGSTCLRPRIAALWPAGAGPRPPQSAYGPSQEREEQGEYARDAKDGAQTLLRGGHAQGNGRVYVGA